MSFTENFDESGLSGGLPSGWNDPLSVGSTVGAENGITPTSPTHMARMVIGGGARAWLTYGTADGYGGNLVLQADVNFYSVSGDGFVGVAARGTSGTLGTGDSAYGATVDSTGGAVAIVLWTPSGTTTLASLSPATPPSGWLTLVWSLSGPSLALDVLDVATGQWLQPGGTWGSSQVVAISTSDSTLSGAGYFGTYTESVDRSVTGYIDSVSVSAGASPPSPILTTPRLRTPARPPRPGRVLQGAGTRMPPNPPTRLVGLAPRSPRVLHAGRVYLPANPGPYSPPPDVHDTPLGGLFVRPDRARPFAARRGSAAVAVPPPSTTIAPGGAPPLIVRPQPSQRRPGRAAVGAWLPPDAPPVAPQPSSGVLRPVGRREPPRRYWQPRAAPAWLLPATPDPKASVGPSSVLRPVAARRPIRVGAGVVRLLLSPSIAPPFVPGPSLPPLSHSALRPISRRERPRPPLIPAWLGGGKRLAIGPGIFYNVYMSPASGDPIDYSAPVATVTGTTWTSSPLGCPGTWAFGVRAEDQWGEEQNVDAVVIVILDQYGNDVTRRPRPPSGLRAFPKKGGLIRVEWGMPPVFAGNAPTSFNVYLTPGPTPSYAVPATTVPASGALLGVFFADVQGIDGVAYSVAVRSVNAYGQDVGTRFTTVTADATGPAPVLGLAGTAVV